MALCGAKTRNGTPCKRHAVKGKTRCKLHGGASSGPPKGSKNHLTHGIYAKGLTAEEKLVWYDVELGSVDNELRMAKIRLARALKAELSNDELELIERSESPALLGGMPDYAEMVKHEVFKKRDWSPIVDKLMARIESLERTRVDLAKVQPVASEESTLPEDYVLRNDEEAPDKPIL